MNPELIKALEEKNAKLMPVSSEVVDSTNQLSKQLGVSTNEILNVALSLLKISVGKEVLVTDTKTKRTIKIPIFEKFKKILTTK